MYGLNQKLGPDAQAASLSRHKTHMQPPAIQDPVERKALLCIYALLLTGYCALLMIGFVWCSAVLPQSVTADIPCSREIFGD